MSTNQLKYSLPLYMFKVIQKYIVEKKWDRCLITRTLYRDKPGCDDWRSWILHWDFKHLVWNLLTTASENGQIIMKKEHGKDNDVVSGILDWSGFKAQIFRWKVFNNKLTTNNKF